MLVGERAPPDGGAPGSPGRDSRHWREAGRFVLATLVLAVLYLAIGEAKERVVNRLMKHGWIFGDPTQDYAERAADIASQSRAREATLGPGRSRAAFDLGVQYGYVSQWRVSHAALPEESLRALADKDLAGNVEQMNANALALGLAEAPPLPTGTNARDLPDRIEADASGAAARIESATSPRLRHVFLLGAMAGTVQARLEPGAELYPAPAQLIGVHATLGGIPEPLWRPLTRVDQGSRAQVLASHRTATDAIARHLATAP
jgi:hypothetical protein